MNMRLAIYALAAKYRLSGADTVQLAQWAELESPPSHLASALPRGLAMLAASLFGLGLICYLAANWDLLGRFAQFALLQTLFLGLCLGALLSKAARVPLALLALLTMGGVFAYFGQTYQTGADPWTLFAIWGALGLLLCVGVRSDVLWTPWALIVGTGIALWIQAHTGHQWRVQPADIQVYVLGWCASIIAHRFAQSSSYCIARCRALGFSHCGDFKLHFDFYHGLDDAIRSSRWLGVVLAGADFIGDGGGCDGVCANV
ncbi:DUF2157 domain-containing protein [Deefgea rivuli]|uniref:DUF2157 domain-containing protein n=1 Tax=Deefgea rivuli TaxID=400948 RepID=UPI0006847E3D|nr:DUF2157 domain-containing protein [Deefgea rivuli]